MKILLAVMLMVGATVAFARPTAAYVVAVTTSVPASVVADDTDLKDALKTAVDDVLSHAIAFRPTFVRVQAANIVRGRLYIMLLIGDSEGEEAMSLLTGDPETGRVSQ
jgi:hypothetical protein